jgi:exopolyphosphatase/guanosine-5'-triphosphate,3'-diphosphate pyrophosphatase
VLPNSWRKPGLRLLMLLRLAVLLNRSRNAAELPEVTISVTENSLSIGFDADWLADNPLTIADLEREQGFLEQVGYKLILE